MNRYLIFLRGINVSGQKKIKMADFKLELTKCGYKNISTILQSGNIIFETNKSKSDVQSEIETLISNTYKFSVPVYVTLLSSITRVLDSIPFKNLDLKEEGSKILVTFLYGSPSDELVNKLLSYVKTPEELVIIDDIIYIYCPNGYGKTKLSNNFIENRLKLTATTRNIKTLAKLKDY